MAKSEENCYPKWKLIANFSVLIGFPALIIIGIIYVSYNLLDSVKNDPFLHIALAAVCACLILMWICLAQMAYNKIFKKPS